ncbi:MAG: hypothetical protein GY697_10305, partial [Desulfobacterales bacterium]|nr:hypothetical protein [Desulfobacterales bacterium]
ATICLYSWSILRYSPGAKENAAFLLYSGLVTTILLLDDFFLLHEELFPLYLGMSEKIFYVGYAGLILYGMVKFKRCTLKTEYVLLLIALLFFGLSVVTDSFQHHLEVFAGDWRILFEDGFKLLGIVSWLGYFFRFSSLAIRESNGRH